MPDTPHRAPPPRGKGAGPQLSKQDAVQRLNKLKRGTTAMSVLGFGTLGWLIYPPVAAHHAAPLTPTSTPVAPPATPAPATATALPATGMVALQHGALAASGVARRRWRQGSHDRHHLLDPRSGVSAQNGVWSVSVGAARCVQAEVAAKVACILGPAGGARFLSEQGLSGVLVQQNGVWEATGLWPASNEVSSIAS